jgi:hypothetical protein
MEEQVGLEDQAMEVMVGLQDQEMEDITQSTDQADQNLVLLVVSENRRKRARTVDEGNSMDKVVGRMKRKNPEDVPGNLHIPTVFNSSSVSLSATFSKSGMKFGSNTLEVSKSIRMNRDLEAVDVVFL